MTAKEYVDIDNNIQLWEKPTDETIIQEALIDEGIGIQGESFQVVMMIMMKRKDPLSLMKKVKKHLVYLSSILNS